MRASSAFSASGVAMPGPQIGVRVPPGDTTLMRIPRGDSSDTITRAIKKGTGELEGAAYEELTYEGYGPGGVAMLIECTSDNRNRTRSEIHTIMAKNGGSLGAPNSVAWMFKSKGRIAVAKSAAKSEDELLGLVLDLGAEEIGRAHV